MLLVIASVTASIMVMNAVLPAIVRGTNSIVNMSGNVEDRIRTQITVVYATGELDVNAVWQDADTDTLFDATVWVKNVGSSRILGIDQMDVFFGKPGSFVRVPYVDDAGGGYPSWTYTIENGTEWRNTVTVKFEIHFESALASDTYLVKFTTPSGAVDEHYFSF